MPGKPYTDTDVELVEGIIADHQHWTGVDYSAATRAVLAALTAVGWRPIHRAIGYQIHYRHGTVVYAPDQVTIVYPQEAT